MSPKHCKTEEFSLTHRYSEGLIYGQLAEYVGPIARKNHHVVRMCDQKETPCFLVYRKQGGIAIGRSGARYTLQRQQPSLSWPSSSNQIL